MSEPKKGGLYRYRIGVPKFLVKRRDGSIPEWPHIVLGAKDKHAKAGLHSYIKACEADRSISRDYVADLWTLYQEFCAYANTSGTDDPDIISPRPWRADELISDDWEKSRGS